MSNNFFMLSGFKLKGGWGPVNGILNHRLTVHQRLIAAINRKEL
jgi:hypothetical protein